MSKKISLDRSPYLVETKLRETEFFLSRMAEAGFDIWAFSCNFSAFLSSSRSVTFAIQSVMNGHPSWAPWYAETAASLFGPRAKLMTDLRNISQKNGEPGFSSGAVKDGMIRHYFEPHLMAGLSDDERDCDVLELCQRHMGVLVHLIATWMNDFASMWGLPDGIDESAATPYGWERHFDQDLTECILMGSPGDVAPNVHDLTNAWSYFPDKV